MKTIQFSINYLLNCIAIVILSLQPIKGAPGAMKTTFRAETEYRNNIVRSLDSLKLNDTRLNIDIGSQYDITLPGFIKAGLSSKFNGHFYSKYSDYNRNDYLATLTSEIALIKNVKLNISDEFRYRDYPNYSAWKYSRNIYDINLVLPIVLKPTIGYQGWSKKYTATNQLADYKSSRYYLKLKKSIGKTGTLLKLESQDHNGNLYPNSSGLDTPNYLTGQRRMVLLSIDQLIGEKLFIEFKNRFEDDTSTGYEFNGDSDDGNEEEIDDLLSEDSDFNYRKYQTSVSLFYQLTPRLSAVSYNVYQNKLFKQWKPVNSTDKRQDNSIYSNNTIIYKLNDRVSIDVKYIIERNSTNVRYFNYQGHSMILGFRYIY